VPPLPFPQRRANSGNGASVAAEKKIGKCSESQVEVVLMPVAATKEMIARGSARPVL
jgi:hypothetical protein